MSEEVKNLKSLVKILGSSILVLFIMILGGVAIWLLCFEPEILSSKDRIFLAFAPDLTIGLLFTLLGIWLGDRWLQAIKDDDLKIVQEIERAAIQNAERLCEQQQALVDKIESKLLEMLTGGEESPSLGNDLSATKNYRQGEQTTNIKVKESSKRRRKAQ